MRGDGRSGNGFVCQGTSTQKLICSDTLSKHARQNSHGGSYGPHSRFKGHSAREGEHHIAHIWILHTTDRSQKIKSQRQNALSESTFLLCKTHENINPYIQTL